MDHKTLIKSLDTKTKISLTQKSDRAGLKRLAAHFGWILVLGCYVAIGAPLWWLALYGFTLILVLFGWSWIFWCWMLPLVLGKPFLRAYFLAEHGLCPQVANIFENTRTTFANRVIRFLAWNMPYPAEHHAYPAVPFYKLPQFHALTRDQLVSTSDGYLRFHMEYRRLVQD